MSVNPGHLSKTSASKRTRSNRAWIPLAVAALIVSVARFHQTAEALTGEAKKTSTTSKLFSGRVQITVPKAANKPQKKSSTTYWIQPKSPSKKFVIVVTKEPLRKDELKKSNKELGDSIKNLLEAQGYEITSLKNQGTTYTAQFQAYTNVPWQLVGTTATRGTAKFVKTQDNQLVGSLLLCDPNQWNDPDIAQFKKAVSGAKVSSK